MNGAGAMSIAINVKEKADLIWAIADKLTGAYKPHEYGKVILPLTVIRRFDCVLANTKDKVLEINKTFKLESMKEKMLCKTSGHSFYNISPFTFERLVDDPDNIATNFRSYLNGFSKNVRNIIDNFKFENEIQQMERKQILYIVLHEFTTAKANFHPDTKGILSLNLYFCLILYNFV